MRPTDPAAGPDRPSSVPTRRAVGAGLAAALLPLGRAAAEPAGATGWRDLRAAPLRARLRPEPAREADLWVFDGAVDPPVIRVRHGDEVRVRLRNDTPADLSLHWHGVRNRNGADGVAGLTQEPVRPGSAFEYRFTPPDPGTSLIRPIDPGRAGEAGGRGLAGLLVVEERDPPPVDAEYALLVRDWALETDGTLKPFGDPREAALAGRLGGVLAAGGGEAPHRIALPPGSRVRLRLANGCNARVTRIRFDGVRVFVAAVDGQPTDAFEPLRSALPFPPGCRYDILLDLPNDPGASGAVTALVGAGVPLVAVSTTQAAPVGAGRAPIASPPPNPLLPREIRLQAAFRREIVLAGGAVRGETGQPVFPKPGEPIWTVDGRPGRTGAPPAFTVRRGQAVVLALVNRTGFAQPIHLHGHVARQLHPLDDGWEPYWLDTLQIPEGRTVQIAFLADNPGRWMLGSTVLERLDAGLWTSFEVTP